MIEALGLKKDPASRSLPIYKRDDKLLIISGIGKVRAGIATAHAIHTVAESEICNVINVGICGAVSPNYRLGEAVIANKIWEKSTEREFYPDVLVSHGLREVSLGTFDKPVTSASGFSCDVVDMEASGVFQAAQLFLASHKLTFLKVVTDHLDVSPTNYSQMLRHYEDSIGNWLPVLVNQPDLVPNEYPITDKQEELIQELVERMRLTASQSVQLRHAVMRFLLKGGESLDFFPSRFRKTSEHKAFRNKQFRAILEVLDC